MASAASSVTPPSNTSQLSLRETRRGKVYIGDLSPQFLRLESQNNPQTSAAVSPQLLSQQPPMMQQSVTVVMATILTINVIEAKLNKNYGMTRMDPYCVIKVGQQIYKTPTAENGAKLPYWEKTMSTAVPDDLTSIEIEVFDEHSFSNDDCIAWGKIALSDSLKRGQAVDDWWPLSGKLGDEKEGMIHLKLSWVIEQRPMYYNNPMMPMMMNPMMMPGQGYVIPPGGPVMPQSQVQVPIVTEEDLKQVKEMFPDMDDDVIKTVLEASGGNKDAAINSLLSMQC